MEERKPMSHFTAGLIIAGVMILYTIVINFLGQGQNQALGWIAYLIFVVALVIFINMYGKANNNKLSFGNLFGYGFKITSIVTLIVIVFMIIFFLAFPEYKEKILEATRIAMEEQGNYTDDQVDQSVSMIDKGFLLVTAGGALFMYLILGAIGSLIGAAIAKKEPHNPLDQHSA